MDPQFYEILMLMAYLFKKFRHFSEHFRNNQLHHANFDRKLELRKDLILSLKSFKIARRFSLRFSFHTLIKKMGFLHLKNSQFIGCFQITPYRI